MFPSLLYLVYFYIYYGYILSDPKNVLENKVSEPCAVSLGKKYFLWVKDMSSLFVERQYRILT